MSGLANVVDLAGPVASGISLGQQAARLRAQREDEANRLQFAQQQEADRNARLDRREQQDQRDEAAGRDALIQFGLNEGLFSTPDGGQDQEALAMLGRAPLNVVDGIVRRAAASKAQAHHESLTAQLLSDKQGQQRADTLRYLGAVQAGNPELGIDPNRVGPPSPQEQAGTGPLGPGLAGLVDASPDVAVRGAQAIVQGQQQTQQQAIEQKRLDGIAKLYDASVKALTTSPQLAARPELVHREMEVLAVARGDVEQDPRLNWAKAIKQAREVLAASQPIDEGALASDLQTMYPSMRPERAGAIVRVRQAGLPAPLPAVSVSGDGVSSEDTRRAALESRLFDELVKAQQLLDDLGSGKDAHGKPVEGDDPEWRETLRQKVQGLRRKIAAQQQAPTPSDTPGAQPGAPGPAGQPGPGGAVGEPAGPPVPPPLAPDGQPVGPIEPGSPGFSRGHAAMGKAFQVRLPDGTVTAVDEPTQERLMNQAVQTVARRGQGLTGTELTAAENVELARLLAEQLQASPRPDGPAGVATPPPGGTSATPDLNEPADPGLLETVGELTGVTPALNAAGAVASGLGRTAGYMLSQSGLSDRVGATLNALGDGIRASTQAPANAVAELKAEAANMGRARRRRFWREVLTRPGLTAEQRAHAQNSLAALEPDRQTARGPGQP